MVCKLRLVPIEALARDLIRNSYEIVKGKYSKNKK